MALKFDSSIDIEDYELLDNKYGSRYLKKIKNTRYGFYWSLQEDLMLTARWFILKGDIHAIAALHKRSFKAICLRLELTKTVNVKFDKEWIRQNNEKYLNLKTNPSPFL